MTLSKYILPNLMLIQVIGDAVGKFTVPELEEMNSRNRQAGVEVLKHEDFLNTPHGQEMQKTPLWLLEPLEKTTPPIPFPPMNPNSNPQILQGIKVLELCRIIAGPTVTRILAEYGAEVLKITSPNLSDVPFFQVDGYPSQNHLILIIETQENEQQISISKPLTIAKFLKNCYKMSISLSMDTVQEH
jgi:hypothetical protein